MFVKNRKKTVGLCVMVVTASLVLATLWAVLATPETALAKKPDKAIFDVDAVSHGGPYDSPTLVSEPDRSGSTSNSTLFVKWPSDAINITPKWISENYEPYALTDDPQLSFSKKKGKIIAVHFWIQDIRGPKGILHSAKITVDPPFPPSPAGFTLHLHADGVEVWRHKGNKGGQKMEMIGTISVGDIVFTLVE